MIKLRRLLAPALLAAAAFSAGAEPVRIRLAPMPGIGQLIPQLAVGLGYFKDEGVDIQFVNVMNYVPDDFYSCQLLNDGTIDAEICWYHRVLFGIGNGVPARAVVLIEEAPHMTILVANRVKEQVRGPEDFKGRIIADSGGFSTKHYLTDYYLTHSGLSPEIYTAAPGEWSEKPALLIQALQDGKVDSVSAMEPNTTKLLAAGLVSPLVDLATGEGTRRALGDVWPARCLYLSPKFIAAHPDRVQRLVNVFVRTLRFIQSHPVDQIVAKLPYGYYAPDMNNDFWAAYKASKIDEIRKVLPSLPKTDFSIPPSAAKVVCEVVSHTPFDDSDEGKYRRTAAQSGRIRVEETYDNRFVEKAMKAFPAAD